MVKFKKLELGVRKNLGPPCIKIVFQKKGAFFSAGWLLRVKAPGIKCIS